MTLYLPVRGVWLPLDKVGVKSGVGSGGGLSSAGWGETDLLAGYEVGDDAFEGLSG